MRVRTMNHSGVGVAITATVESMASGLAGVRFDRARAAQRREGPFAAKPMRVVAGGHEELASGTKTVQREGERRCCEPSGDMLGGLRVELDQHPESGGSLDESGDSGETVRSDDEVALPVAWHSSVLDLSGPVGDVDHPIDHRPGDRASAAWSSCTRSVRRHAVSSLRS